LPPPLLLLLLLLLVHPWVLAVASDRRPLPHLLWVEDVTW
jgi:hypothetical protein